jgi:hypothetical protein
MVKVPTPVQPVAMALYSIPNPLDFGDIAEADLRHVT